ncbi:MAG TPA: metallophosphoesterase family protein, partial [Solirubrobacteraceae bacterium]|nr:metallophosphoesterase family protein [Solirubrobacteraceae bacterium]
LAVWSFSAERSLSVGTISLSVSPFHPGALDAYVPVVDWGVRFPGVRLPARLMIELRTVDRTAVAGVVHSGLGAARQVRGQVRAAVVSYLTELALLATGGSFVLGALMAAALRPRRPRARWLLLTSGLVAGAWLGAIALLLAPRGNLGNPVYYAHGSDIPVALRAVEAASKAPGHLTEEVDAQLLGLARLVTDPARRVELAGLPRLTLASDLHNNVVAIPVLRGAAAGGPVFFPGDLTDRGTPLEMRAVGSAVTTGRPFVFVAGNHDSDTASLALARAGAIVLTRRGQLLPSGRYGPGVVDVLGLRVAGYESPNERRAADGYRDRGAAVTPAEQADFQAWLAGLIGRVDVVMVHEPALAAPAIAALRAAPSLAPLLVLDGHTHTQSVESRDGVAEVNGGTVGAGGTGNLVEGQPIGLAVVTYRPRPFAPLAVDLIQVAPGTGSGAARRLRLDQGPGRRSAGQRAGPLSQTMVTGVPTVISR